MFIFNYRTLHFSSLHLSYCYIIKSPYRAVDVSSGGDYRAWYGLGQTYEVKTYCEICLKAPLVNSYISFYLILLHSPFTFSAISFPTLLIHNITAFPHLPSLHPPLLPYPVLDAAHVPVRTLLLQERSCSQTIRWTHVVCCGELFMQVPYSFLYQH